MRPSLSTARDPAEAADKPGAEGVSCDMEVAEAGRDGGKDVVVAGCKDGMLYVMSWEGGGTLSRLAVTR